MVVYGDGCAEFLALTGANKIIDEDKPMILLEINSSQLHKVSGCTANDLISMMRSFQYKCYLIGKNGIEGEVDNYEKDDIRNVLFSIQPPDL